jgi:hypothetical protein
VNAEGGVDVVEVEQLPHGLDGADVGAHRHAAAESVPEVLATEGEEALQLHLELLIKIND